MSDHTICDKCMKVIDGTEAWVRITSAELVVEADGTTVVTPAVTYDYHPNHAPKLVKGQPEEPEGPEVDNTLPEPEG